MMLQVLDLINTHSNWRDKLSGEPYCIKIKEDSDSDYVLLNYDQFKSDFNHQITRECRGLILKKTYQQMRRDVVEMCVPACVGFYKFGNYGESYCSEIDWNSARVREKVDGTFIMVWFDDEWRISTRGTINAYNALVNGTSLTFGRLFDKTLISALGQRFEYDFLKRLWFYEILNENYTYMFELCCPENRVVVPHSEAKLYHIGTRNNKTLEELDVSIDIVPFNNAPGILKPKEYSFNSPEECIQIAKTLNFRSEGYVVVDKHWNRVKIKSPAYIAAFHMKNNGVITTERIINLIRSGEETEFLTYYPEYKDAVEAVKTNIDRWLAILTYRIDELSKRHFETQKEFAMAIKSDKYSPYFFLWRKTGITPKEWSDRLDSRRLAKYIKEIK